MPFLYPDDLARKPKKLKKTTNIFSDFIETYKDRDIYYYYPGEYPGYQDDGYATAAINRLYSNLPDLRSAIDLLPPLPNGPPEPPPPILIETYRGIDIWMDVETEIPFFTYDNFPHQYLAGTPIQDIRDDIDAILDAPPPAAGITVYLDPPLEGARLEFRYRSYGMDQYVYHKFSDVTGMTNWPQGGFTGYDLFSVLFPTQTLGGVQYLAASTPLFMYQAGDQTFTLLIEEIIQEPTITITDVTQPTQLDAGEIPTLAIRYDVIAPAGLIQLLVRIYNIDTGALVCETGTSYHGTGSYEWNISSDSWLSSMPAEAWNLRVEIVRWWP